MPIYLLFYTALGFIVLLAGCLVFCLNMIKTQQQRLAFLYAENVSKRLYYGYDERITYTTGIVLSAADRVGIRLTAGALEMLAIPLREIITIFPNGRFQPSTSSESLELIMRTMQSDPSVEDRELEGGQTRSSLSVIRALWRNFCNIPPFCDGRERG